MLPTLLVRGYFFFKINFHDGIKSMVPNLLVALIVIIEIYNSDNRPFYMTLFLWNFGAL